MEITNLLDYAFSTGNLWAVLFVYLFVTNRKESKDREKELMQSIKNSNDQHLKISQSMENLEKGMQTLSTQFKDLSFETRDGFTRVWEKFGEIKK